MVAISIDVLLASLVLATILAVSIYSIVTYSGIYSSEAEYLVCLSNAVRYSDFFLHTRGGIALTRSGVLVYGRADCSHLPDAYARFSSRGFSARVCCGGVCAGPDGNYVVILHRTVYWPGHGVVPFTVAACRR